LRLDTLAVTKLLSNPRFSFQAPTSETPRNLLRLNADKGQGVIKTTNSSDTSNTIEIE